jgi:hypothetical protein
MAESSTTKSRLERDCHRALRRRLDEQPGSRAGRGRLGISTGASVGFMATMLA